MGNKAKVLKVYPKAYTLQHSSDIWLVGVIIKTGLIRVKGQGSNPKKAWENAANKLVKK